MRQFLIFILMVLAAGTVLAQADSVPDTVTSAPGITVETAVDRSEIFIGDLIAYRLTIYHDSNIILTPPPIGANLGAFDVKDYQADNQSRTEDGRIKLESRFLLTTFTTGDYIIPPIPIEYMTGDSVRKVLVSEPIAIRVKSLIGENADTLDIRDIKPPISFASSYAWLYYAIPVFLILAGLAYWLIRKLRRKKVAGEPIDLREPWEIAFEALAMLREKNLPTTGDFKQYYIELTEIFRAYLGRIYNIPVMDMTTDEFCGNLAEMNVEADLFARVKKLLNFADLVKFAKFLPEQPRAEADFGETHDLVELIRQKEITRRAMAVSAATTATTTSGGEGNV